MNAELRWQGGVRFQAETGSGHSLTIDGAVEGGGTNAGPRPMELVLIGAGGCAAYDVVHILGRQREDVTDCVIKLDAERAEEPPRVFTKIHMHFVVTGRGLSPVKVERAVALSSEKYCSASIMLRRGGVDVQTSFEVIEAAE